MEYKVIASSSAKDDLDAFIGYIIKEKHNPQAALSVIEDYEDTVNILKRMAESFAYCKNEKLKELGYRRINFINHRYFVLYRVKDDIVYIDDVFHELQDYESKIK